MANDHTFGIGDSAEQSDNLQVQAAIAAVHEARFATYGVVGNLGVVFEPLDYMWRRFRATRLLNRYERTWGEFVPNQAAKPVE